MITNSKIARSLLVPISSIINACFCCSEDKKLRGFTFANCKSLSPLGRRRWKKNLRHCRNRFSKMIFQTSWNEESRHNNEHLILQKLTLDPFKQGFILVFQFENFQVQIVSQIVIGFKLWFVKKPKCVWKQPVWLQFWVVPKWNLVKKLAMTAF